MLLLGADMSRLRLGLVGSILLGIGTCVGVGTAVTACSDADTGIFVEGVIAPRQPECTVSADPGSDHVGRGLLDVAFSLDYTAWLLVGNQFTPRGDKEQVRTETMHFVAQGAEVELLGSDLEPLDGSQSTFTVPVSGFVAPTSAESPGFGVVLTTLIPQAVGQSLRNDLEGTSNSRTVVVEVRVFGETVGGTEVESSVFTFPIDVCSGCLVSFPLDALTQDVDGLACIADAEEVDAAPCRFGQDEGIDCRLCAAQNDECLRP